jgi:hypothetical protein
MAIAAGGIVLGGVVVTQQGGGASTANIWVDSNGGTCVDQASLTAYVDADACATFDAANDVAQSGDTIRVKSGTTYGAQSITGTNGRTSAATFKPETDAGTISVSAMVEVTGSWLTFQKLVWTDQTNELDDITKLIKITGGASNIRVEDSDGSLFQVFAASFVTISGGDWGPCHVSSATPGEACAPKIAADGAQYATDVVVENTSIHDMTTYDPGSHTGGLMVFSGNERVTIRGNKLWNTTVYGIFLAHCCGSTSVYQAKDVLIENNWISSTTNYMISLCKESLSYENVLIRYNSGRGGGVCMCANADQCASAGTYTNVRLVGNVNDYVSNPVGCTWPTNVTLNYEVYKSNAGTSCGGTNTGTTTQQFVNSVDTSAINLHLVDTSVVANNFVTDNTGDYVLSTDYDGASRSSPRDAGSDEQ